MRIGAVFPGIELGSDPAVIRDWVQAAEELGYEHCLVFDHLVGFAESPNPSYNGPITPGVIVHEPLVLLAFLAALTQRVTLFTGVLVLPMRQTVAVAKQAAEIDALSGGRLRLGVGVGHVEREFEALNESYHTRGQRIEEQIDVLRALWTQDSLTYRGRWHQLPDSAGLMGPRPVQRPIPIWVGGNSETALARAARLADGWAPVLLRPDDEARAVVARFWESVEQNGRASDTVGLDVFLPLRFVDASSWRRDAESWLALGATHLSVELEGAGLKSPQAHLDALRQVRAELSDLG